MHLSPVICGYKESPEIFSYALNWMDVSPEESVFIDNNRGNLIAASALGIKTVFHDDEKNDIEALTRTLKALGVVVGNV